MKRKHIFPTILLSTAGLALSSFAMADTVTTGSATVNAADDIYAAGSQSSLATSSGVGNVPGYISVGGSTYVTLTATGTITLDGSGGAANDPDGLSGGVPAYGLTTSYESGYGSISGITAPGAGYLVGVFLTSSGPTGSAPASLTYTTADTEDASYSPLLDQVFFIGDGLTGDGSGANQLFYVPAGATELYLGISDACGFSGGPSCYSDNFDNLTVNYSDVTDVVPVSATPEPSSLLLLATGALSAAGAIRRKILI